MVVQKTAESEALSKIIEARTLASVGRWQVSDQGGGYTSDGIAKLERAIEKYEKALDVLSGPAFKRLLKNELRKSPIPDPWVQTSN